MAFLCYCLFLFCNARPLVAKPNIRNGFILGLLHIKMEKAVCGIEMSHEDQLCPLTFCREIYI